MIRFTSVVFITIITCCLLTVSLSAQKLSFETFTTEDGLSKNYIGSIAQDQYGFIWIGSSQGLNRYDGYQFRTYHHQPSDSNSLSHNVINTVFTNSQGELWVGTAQGLNRYDASKEAFYHFEALADRQVFTLYEGTQGVLWVGTDQGVFVFQGQSFQFLPFTEGYHIRAIAHAKDKNLLLATDEGLFEASADYTKIHKVPALKGVDYISDILFFQDKIWIATREEGIYTLDPDNLSLLTHFSHDPDKPQSLNANDVLCMLSTSDGQLWVGTDLGGLHLLDSAGTGFIHYTSDSRAENSLSSNNILFLFEDKDQNLWVGTNYGGLNFSAKDEFFRYYKSNPHHFRSSSVHAMYQDSQDQLWVGSGGNGLSMMSADGKLLATYSREAEDSRYHLEGNTIQTIAEDNQGRIWVGMYEHGINVIEPGKGVIKTFRVGQEGLRHDDVRKILIDRRERIWIATKGGGLHTYLPSEDRIVPIGLHTKNKEKSNMMIWLYEGRDGKLWLGNFEGKAYYFEPDQLSLKYQLHESPWGSLPSFVTALQEDQKGNYWLGTWDRGLYYWDKQVLQLKHYDQHKGINDSKIRAILSKGKGALWLSTSSGLAKYQPGNDTFKWFGSGSAMRFTDFLFGASFQSSDGTFFFGSDQGLYAFQPGQQNDKPHHSTVYLSGLKIMGEKVEAGGSVLPRHIAFTDEIELSPAYSVFTIDFVASRYPHAGQQRYAVKLEGFEEEWRALGNKTSATYTNIKPGEYLFRVKLLGENMSPEAQGASVKIIIHPPFWQTPLAFLLYFIALIVIIYLARRFTIARIQLKNDLMQERKEREKEEEIHQMKLNFFTGLSHEFRTPLMLIINPLEKLLGTKKDKLLKLDRNEAVMMERNAQRLLRLINQLLTFRKLETSHDELHLGTQDVASFVQHVFQYFEDLADRENIDFQYDVKAELPQVRFDVEKMETVLYNLLSNAFKFTPPHGSVYISVDVDHDIAIGTEGYFLIKVEDNGVGIPQHLQQYIFDRYYQIDVHHMNGNSGTGIGLALVKKIVEMHEGKVSVHSREGQGSCFTVALPMKRPAAKVLDAQPKLFPEEVGTLLPPEDTFHAEEYENVTHGDKKQTAILLVDDNHEVRSYLKSIFSHHFHVLEAINGKEALDLLADCQPALIISDVMMPEMDGITFCKKVKSNMNTHQIPLILLTARSGEEGMLQALRAGADDYLEKPIHIEALLLKVKNTLAYREEVRKELSRGLTPDPQIEAHQSADQVFLDAAMQIVERNIENTEFSVEEFAVAIGVSKTHLYNKLKGLTGLSANEFIRSTRLKKAVSLLEQERWSVSEVAYMVGFNNPNYFSKCFIREYGISPSKFEANQQKLED